MKSTLNEDEEEEVEIEIEVSKKFQPIKPIPIRG